MNKDYNSGKEKSSSLTDEISHKETPLPTHWIMSFSIVFVLPSMLAMGSIFTHKITLNVVLSLRSLQLLITFGLQHTGKHRPT
jgi:hypothetical protein